MYAHIFRSQSKKMEEDNPHLLHREKLDQWRKYDG